MLAKKTDQKPLKNFSMRFNAKRRAILNLIRDLISAII